MLEKTVKLQLFTTNKFSSPIHWHASDIHSYNNNNNNPHLVFKQEILPVTRVEKGKFLGIVGREFFKNEMSQTTASKLWRVTQDRLAHISSNDLHDGSFINGSFLWRLLRTCIARRRRSGIHDVVWYWQWWRYHLLLRRCPRRQLNSHIYTRLTIWLKYTARYCHPRKFTLFVAYLCCSKRIRNITDLCWTLAWTQHSKSHVSAYLCDSSTSAQTTKENTPCKEHCWQSEIFLFSHEKTGYLR